MNIDVTLQPLCYKCDRLAIAVGDSNRPLCSRHAMLFVTAPRLLALERTNELVGPRGSEADPAVNDGDKPADRTESFLQAMERFIERLEAFEQTIGSILTPQPSTSRDSSSESVPNVDEAADNETRLRLVDSPTASHEHRGSRAS